MGGAPRHLEHFIVLTALSANNGEAAFAPYICLALRTGIFYFPFLAYYGLMALVLEL